jgi:hypothetical protein
MCACTAGNDSIDVAPYGDINNKILSKIKFSHPPSAFFAFRSGAEA